VGSVHAWRFGGAYGRLGCGSSRYWVASADSYSYDSVGRLTALASSQAGTFRYAYDESGRRSSLQRPNGVTTSYAYNTADQVTSIIHAKAGATLDETRYTYDAFGRRTVVRQHDGDHTYGYDAAGRVTSADNPAGQADETFTYDDLGNRTSAGEQYDAANRLQSRTGYTYLSDREGRITDRIASNGDATRFSWDAQDRLRTITLPDGSVTRLRYDPLGRRVATTRDGQTRVQTYGLDPNAVAETTGSASTRYTFGVGYDTPLAMSTAATTSYFQQDALGSVTSLTSATGAITGRYTYDTYGQIGADSPYTYTGREWDAPSGLYHYRARWYEPSTGRFISEDPVPAANLYHYALGSPTDLADPSGRDSLADQSATQMIIGTLANYGKQALVGTVLGGVGSGLTNALFQQAKCGNIDADQVRRAAVKGAVLGGIGVPGGALVKEAVLLQSRLEFGFKLIAVAHIVYAGALAGGLYAAAEDPNWMPDIGTTLEALPNFASVIGDMAGGAGVLASAVISEWSGVTCPLGGSSGTA
jgi:RHS repeat-associated protein